jgi:hypothetical protein
MTLSLLVPQEALPKVWKRLDKLARTAGVLIEEVPGTTTLIRKKTVLTCARITIGDLPSVGGYEFAARIEHGKDGNVIARGPKETEALDTSWRMAAPHCEHCNTNRRRKETFLLRQYGMRLIQIGRNCLADFLMVDPAQMIALAELVKAISEEGSDEHWGGYGGFWDVAPIAYLACAVATTERDGFVKSKDPSRTPTHVVATWLSQGSPGSADAHARWLAGQPNEDHIETAHAVLAWCANPGENPSEYRWNLSLAVKVSGVGKHAGLLASAPAAYNRELGKLVAKKLPEKRAEGYAVEKHMVFKGEVTLVRHYLMQNDFGSKAICTFRTDEGHDLVWFASGVAPKPDMQGMRFQIKGRCKSHKPAQGKYAQQAELARVTWKPVEAKEESQAS